MPKNNQIWPKIGILGHFGPGLASYFGALLVGWLVGWLVVVTHGLYLARHLSTFCYQQPTESLSLLVEPVASVGEGGSLHSVARSPKDRTNQKGCKNRLGIQKKHLGIQKATHTRDQTYDEQRTIHKYKELAKPLAKQNLGLDMPVLV